MPLVNTDLQTLRQAAWKVWKAPRRAASLVCKALLKSRTQVR